MTSTVRPAPVQTSARSPKTAFRTDDFDGALAKLTASGFREDAAQDDPMRLIVRRNGPAGYPQLFLLDPDRNIIELNGAP